MDLQLAGDDYTAELRLAMLDEELPQREHLSVPGIKPVFVNPTPSPPTSLAKGTYTSSEVELVYRAAEAAAHETEEDQDPRDSKNDATAVTREVTAEAAPSTSPPDWGNWNSGLGPPPNETMPSPPPPNQQQLQQQQLGAMQKRTPSSMYNSWAEVLSQASMQKAVMEQIRELECEVLVDFKLSKGQADVRKHRNKRDLTLKANEIVSTSDMMDLTRKPASVLIWGAHHLEEGKYVLDANTPTAANWLRATGNRETFAKGLAEGAIIVLRSYPIMMKYVPITFVDLNNPKDLKEIVAKVRLDPNLIIGGNAAYKSKT